MHLNLFLLLTLLTLIGMPAFADDQTIEIPRIAVEDGDTLIAHIDGVSERLQLAYIDAPEDNDNAKLRHDVTRTGLAPEALLMLGSAATDHLRSLTAEDGPFLVVYDPDARDHYGRITAGISDKNGRSLSASMLGDGYAKVLVPRKAGAEQPPSELFALETEAIVNGRGIWGADATPARAWHGGLQQ